MNKYLLPIYHSKLKPWIKYWLYKHTEKVPVPVLSDWTEGYSPIELSNAFPDTTLQDLSLIGNILQTGIPTPTNPVAVQTVSGSNTITLNNTSNYKVDLASNNLSKITSVVGNNFTYGLPTGATQNVSINSFDYTSIDFTSTVADYNIALTNTIQLKPDTQYTLSFKRTSTATNNQTFIYNVASDNTYSVNWRDANQNIYTHTFTTNNIGKIALAFGHSNVTGHTQITEIMLNEGETALPYEPYYNYELCKIGDYEDKIYKDNDKWYIEKNIGKRTYNNSESEYWQMYSVAQGSLFRVSQFTGVKKVGTLEPLCNFYKGISFNQIANRQNNQCYYNYENNLFDIIDNRFNSLDSFKAWLNTNNLPVYYVLAEKTTTEITSDTTLYTQLESIVTDMKLTSGNNKIKQTNADLPFYLLFKYYMKG